jgi:CubicO group peptidase (beta-lactamase class C family)
MKRCLSLLIGLAGLFATTLPVRADKVDDLIHDEMQKHHVAGLALLVVENGQPIKTQGYGVANLEWNVPVDKDTVFEIGSITKQFTAACILLLAEDGKLSVDDLISSHLKNTPPAWSKITIRHLLTHTSGIPNYTVLDGFELTKHLTQDQFIQKLGAYPLSFQPGDSWSYCNSGFNLLGFIVENASGKKYWDFIQERIFTPLGMTSTGNRTPGVIVPHRAAGYERTGGHPINRDYDLTDIFSAGAIISTVVDMGKWNAALDGDKLLKESSKQLWWTPTRLNNGTIKNYGFGWTLDPLGGHKNIGHGGATSGFSATIQRFPEDKLSLIILCNADENGLATSIGKKVAQLHWQETGAKK